MPKKNYIIKPPPEDKGEEPLFSVVYVIDVAAADETKAAEKTWHLMRDESSLPPVLVVIDSQGKRTRLDLARSRKD